MDSTGLEEQAPANQHDTVYFFVGCILAGDKFWNYIPAAIVAFIGLAYIALEFVPSIEPPANMRYVSLVFKHEGGSRTDTDIYSGTPTQAGAPSRSKKALQS